MADTQRWMVGSLASLLWLCTTHAHAHIKLLSPASWLNEDSLGGPQKGSPCGPGNSRPFIGDDMQPIPTSAAVTSFHAGETIRVELQETVYHPGYFRIAIADTTAADATTEHFPDPALTDPVGCYYDNAAVMTEPHGDVLADGLFMASGNQGTGRSLQHEVTLPDEPCEHCSLQIVQVMEGHGASSCFYYHCADIEILPAGDHDHEAGDGSEPPATDADSGGCTIARAGTRGSPVAATGLLTLVCAQLVRRRRRRFERRR